MLLKKQLIREVGLVAGIVIGYSLAVLLSKLFILSSSNLSLLWLPAGAAMLSCYAFGWRAIWGLLLAIVINTPDSISQFVNAQWLASLAFLVLTMAKLLQGVVAGRALRALVSNDSQRHWLLRCLQCLTLFAVASSFTSVTGVVARLMTDAIDISQFWRQIFPWFAGDVLGMLVISPLVLLRPKLSAVSRPFVLLNVVLICATSLTLLSTLLIQQSRFQNLYERSLLVDTTKFVNLIEYVIDEQALEVDKLTMPQKLALIGQWLTVPDPRRRYRQVNVVAMQNGQLATYQWQSAQAEFILLDGSEPMFKTVYQQGFEQIPSVSQVEHESGESWIVAQAKLSSLGVVYSESISTRNMFLPMAKSAIASILLSLVFVAVASFTFTRISEPLVAKLAGRNKELEEQAAIRAQQLERGKEQLNRILTSVPGVLYECEIDRNWTMRFISEEVVSLTGYQAEELVGNNKISFAELIHPDDAIWVNDAALESIQQRQDYTLEYRIVHKSGDVRWIRESGRAVTAQNGENVLYGYMNDITQSRQALDDLRVSEQKLELALRAGQMYVWEPDIRLSRVETADFMHEVLGYRSDDPEQLFHLWTAALVPEDLVKLRNTIRQMPIEESRLHIQLRVRAANDELHWVEFIGEVSARNRRGGVDRLVGVLRDVTLQKQHDIEEQEKLAELEAFNRVAVDREVRMIELKQEVNQLRRELGRAARYEKVGKDV